MSWAVYDADNDDCPDDAKIPLKKIADEHDDLKVNYLCLDSGKKGYHLEVFFSAPIHTREVEQFQNVIMERCAAKDPGFRQLTENTWAYFTKDKPYNPKLEIKDQEHTTIEFLTSMGDGKLIKAPFSKHPKHPDRLELPMTIAQIEKQDRSEPPTVEDVKRGCNLIKRVKKTPYERILDIAQIEDPQKPIPTKFKKRGFHTRVKFTTPDPSADLDLKCEEIFARVLNVPCLQHCYEVSTSHRGIYQLRANLVTALASMDFTREEIAYWFKHHINDDADNANKGMLETQVDYWHSRQYHCRCEYYQEVDNDKFCCDNPCGRRHPAQDEPEPDHIHLTRVQEFEAVYHKCREIINSGHKKVVVKKTTRAGVTTALTIVAKEENKRVLFLVPRTSIAELTFPDTICLAHEKRGVIINGFVIAANQKSCLQRLKEKLDWEKEHGRPLQVSIPVPRDDCKTCIYNGTIVIPAENQPLCHSDPDNNTCAQSTYKAQRDIFDAGFTTYAKLHAILNTPSQDSFDILDDVKQYDVLVFDEISQFVESSFLEIPLHAKHRHENLTYNFCAVLNKQLNNYLQWIELGETSESIHQHISLFISEYEDYSKYKDGEEIQNPLDDEERTRLKSNMIVYLNNLYNYALLSGNDVGAIYSAMCLLCEEKWYISKTQTMEYETNINFIVPPKNREIVEWLKDFEGQIIITDATMPTVDLKNVFGEDIVEMPVDDPLETANKQLIICDSMSVSPTRVFTEAGKERLQAYVHAINNYHKNGYLVATSNSKTRQDYLDTIPNVIPEDVTYQRSNKTIGVACNHRAMITVSSPYAPKNAFQWLSMNLVGDGSLSERIWKVNARNSYFQTISRCKDPLSQTLSVVYAYGIKQPEMEHLLKGCVGIPHIIETPILKDADNAHVIIAHHWLTNGACNLSTNQLKVLILHTNGLTPKAIREKTRLDAKFITNTIEHLGL